jgi:hypothetical protein
VNTQTIKNASERGSAIVDLLEISESYLRDVADTYHKQDLENEAATFERQLLLLERSSSRLKEQAQAVNSDLFKLEIDTLQAGVLYFEGYKIWHLKNDKPAAARLIEQSISVRQEPLTFAEFRERDLLFLYRLLGENQKAIELVNAMLLDDPNNVTLKKDKFELSHAVQANVTPLAVSDGIASSDTQQILAVKSWTAYVLPISIPIVIASGFSTAGFTFTNFIALLLLARAVYKFFELQSHKLYANDEGVFYEGGILPWAKGAIGAKWRDIDSAAFLNSPLSWAAKSFDVRVLQRFTQGAEIHCTSMSGGDKAVDVINATLVDLARTDSLG